MIVSDKYKFVFIQVPRTASSFLGNYFNNKYAGERVLVKHSTYRHFLEIATPLQKKYPVLIGKRNPLNKATTIFTRTMNTRGYQFNDINDVQERFETWFYNRVMCVPEHRTLKHLEYSYPFANYIISQENLLEDVKSILDSIDVDFVEMREWKKKTAGKLSNYLDYYSESLIPQAIKTFKNEMELLNYEVPAEWKKHLE